MSKHSDEVWELVLAILSLILLLIIALTIVLVGYKINEEDKKEARTHVDTIYLLHHSEIDSTPMIFIEPEPEKELAWDWATPSSALEEPKKAIQPVLAPALLPVGGYELTAYIATGNPCADGVYPSTWWTAACNDPALWHKTIHIEGYGDFYVHDTGGMASNVIDIFVGSYDEAINFGRKYAEVYVYE